MSNYKRRNFLNLPNDNLSNIKLSYTKERPWIEQFSFSNLLCTQATQAISNHTPIGEYRLRFFPSKYFRLSVQILSN